MKPPNLTLARALRADQFPEWANLPMEALPSPGTDNAIFRLGESLCMRMPRVDWAAGAATREIATLSRFPDMPLKVPKPIALGQPGRGYPWAWSVLGWIEGETLEGGSLSRQDAVALAEFILAMRAVPTDPEMASGPANHFRGVPLAQRSALVARAIATLSDEYDGAALSKFWRTCLEAESAHTPVWLHGDLHGGNILVRNGRLAAVIDWGLSGVGDGACDLAAAWTLFDTEARDVFRDAMGSDEDEWLRGAGWALSVAVIFLAYYRDKGVPIDGSRRTVARLLASFP